MKIVLCVVGKTTTGYVKEGVEEYASRVRRFLPFDLKIIPDIRTTKKITIQAQKGVQILSQVASSDYVVLLDERGREFTSRGFSEFIEHKAQTLQKNMIFVVGGPYGFSEAVYARADMLLSLSKMTFPLTISRNLPYHHD